MPAIRLAVDANIVVPLARSERGLQLLQNPVLRLIMAEYTFAEVEEHAARLMRERVENTPMTPEQGDALLADILAAVRRHVERVPLSVYMMHEDEARRRITDPDDWHTVALALRFGLDIWTNDNHFLGCGVATWTSESLRRRLTIG